MMIRSQLKWELALAGHAILVLAGMLLICKKLNR